MKSRSLDKVLLAVIGTLLVLGLITLASASSAYSQRNFGSPYAMLLRQLGLGLGAGTILFFAGLKIPPATFRKYAPLILIVSLLLVLGVFVPGLGPRIKGAHRWIYIGPLSFQPSEVLKLAVIIYLAAWMSSRKKEVSTFSYGFIPFLAITGFISLFLILEPDIGTLGIILLTSLGVFFMGGGRAMQIIAAVGLGLALVLLLILLSGYRQDRLATFLDPQSDTQRTGYQLDQSLIAIGSGGLFGRGLGYSRQKYAYLPEPAGDAVFAIFAEEFGLLGVVVLLAIFLTFFIRGMMVAVHAPDAFSALLASGITLLVVVQVIVNIGALSGIFPLTGIPLPSVSYGGTALAFLLFEMGILLHISQLARKKTA